jgi:tetratricopeptide (TPR) repeat protein
MIRDGDLKYVAAPSPELFDLAADPGENVNLHGSHPEEGRLAGELAAFLAAADRTSAADAHVELDTEAAERLRSLGYLSGGATTIEPRATLGRDPKEMIDYIQREDTAIEMIAAGKIEEGLARLREHLFEVPENYVSRFRVATLLLAVGQESEAELELRAVLAEDPEFYPAVLTLAKTHAALGEIDASIAGFARAADLAPTLAQPHHELALTLESYGRYDAAADAYAAALALEPTSFEIARAILALREGRGDLTAGIDEVRAVSQAHPLSAPLWTVIAEGCIRLGRLQEAVEAVRRARELDPHLHDAGLVDGDLHLRAGRAAQAERIFRGLLTSSPIDGPAHFGLARALLEQNRVREADVELGIVLEIDSGYSAAHTVRGRYLEKRGDARGAERAYRMALSVNPGDREAAEGLARVRSFSAPN